ncbi:hypothetical protein C8R46DRAFT_1059080 [Mycena filopes]|nr:hypothetical protein C8R46DRAFT_1059080 [Mycena filopes]
MEFLRPKAEAEVDATGSQLASENSFPDSDEHSDDELEQKPLVAPSTHIKRDFKAALKEGFSDDFDPGVFAFSQRYELTPNPCLNIGGVGTVGIPLGARDARAIIAVSANGETNTTGIWEIPAEKLHFANPAWDIWIQKTAGVAASNALTAAYAVATPTFILKKLVIHEAGSEPIIVNESNTRIGDFVVVLPGAFEGAQLQLRHAGQTNSFDFAHQSGLLTSVLAAYSGVEHTLLGVSAGYRLSLVYDIVQPTTHAVSHPVRPGAIQKLHHIMLSWKQNATGKAPTFLACLLQHKYARTPDFSATSLIAADALLLSHLYPLARELRFCIYLAHVKLTVTVPCYADEFSLYGPWDDFREREDEVEESFDIVQVVDLHGMPVSVKLDLDNGDLLNGSVTDAEPDKSKFERDEHTVAFKRTVLLIWPKDNVRVGIGNIYDYACHALRSSLTVSPTENEKKLVECLLECCRVRPEEAKLRLVVQVLRESADRWNDVQMLLRAARVCGVDKNTDIMGQDGFVSAYQAFGWHALKDFYTEVATNDESDSRRHALVARLAQMAKDEEDAEVVVWCTDQADRVLRSLKKIDAAQIPWLTDVGLARGGEFLRDVILPQLHEQQLDKTFWMPFIQELQLRIVDISTTSTASVKALIGQCVAETVRTLPAFPTKIPSSYPQKDCDATLELIKLCVSTKNEVLCGQIFTKMREAAARGTYPAAFPPWLYYAELSPALILYMRSIAGHNTLGRTFRPFFLDVIESMVAAARVGPDGKPGTPCPLADEHKSIIMAAARQAGGIPALQQRYVATGIILLLNTNTLKGHDSSTLQALVRFIAKEFPRHEQCAPGAVLPYAYDELILILVRAAIDAFDTSLLAPPPLNTDSGWQPTIPPSEHIIRLVRFCFELGAPNECQHLFLRLVPPPAGSTLVQHVSTALAPFLPVLQAYLVSQRLDLEAEPYKKFAVAIIKSFAAKVMVQRATVSVAQIQATGCQNCSECPQLRVFLLSEEPTISFQRGSDIRTHLKCHLNKLIPLGLSCATAKRKLKVYRIPLVVCAFNSYTLG